MVSFLLAASLALLNFPIEEKVLRFRAAIPSGDLEEWHTDVIQDDIGFFWISTKARGIYRFDGVKAKPHRHDPFLSGGPVSNSINLLVKSTDGGVWAISKDAGVSLWDPRLERFTNYENVVPAAFEEGEHYVSGEEDASGRLWLITNDGNIDVLLPDTGSILDIDELDAYKSKFGPRKATALLAYDADWMWIGDDGGGVSKYNIRSGELARLPTSEMQSPISFLYRDRSDKIWIGNAQTVNNRGGLFGFNEKLSSFYKVNIASKDQSCVINGTKVDSDQNGNLWFARQSNRGNIDDMCEMNPLEGVIRHVVIENRTEGKFYDSTVSSIAVGRQGSIWVTTVGGVWVANTTQSSFTNYTKDPQNPNSLDLTGQTIMALSGYEDGSLLLATRNNGLLRQQGYSNNFVPISRGGSGPSGSRVLDIRRSEDSESFFIGFAGSGLDVYNISSKRFTNYRPSWNNISDGYTKSRIENISNDVALQSFVEDPEFNVVREDQNGDLWIGTENVGLVKLDLDQKKFVLYQYNSNSPNPNKQTNSIQKIHIDSRGTLWLGYREGLKTFDPENNIYTTIKFSSDLDDNLDPIITAITEDEKGDLWVGTRVGLFHVDQITPTPQRFQSNSIALSSDSIEDLLLDNNGDIWVSSIEGLSKIDLEIGGTVATYTTDDGLATNKFISEAYKGPSGRLYFASLEGLTFTDPGNSGGTFSSPPPTLITDFFIGGSQVRPNEDGALKAAPFLSKKVDLASHQNSLGFSFSVLDYRSPKKNGYYYRLDPLQEEWTQSSELGQSTAQFDGLLPGTYTFYVKGFDSDGLESSVAAQMTIRIHPPWYKSGWAYILYGFSISLLLGTIIYRKTNQMQKERERDQATINKLQELDQMKTAVIANMSHEIRTPLTSIIGYAELLEEAEPREILHYSSSISNGARRLMNTLNSLLDLAQLEGKHIKLIPSPSPLISSVKSIIEEQGPMARRNNVNISIGKRTTKEVWTFSDSIALDRVLVNIIGNAVKFTSDGEVTINVYENGTQGIVQVKDNGIGISEEFLPTIFEQFTQESKGLARNYEGNGVGLSIAKHLLELMNGRIEVISTKGVGSSFYVSLPLATQIESHSSDEIEGKSETGIPEQSSLVPISGKIFSE